MENFDGEIFNTRNVSGTLSICTENDRQILEKTLASLKEGSNNVVFIGKLRGDVQKSKLGF